MQTNEKPSVKPAGTAHTHASIAIILRHEISDYEVWGKYDADFILLGYRVNYAASS